MSAIKELVKYSPAQRDQVHRVIDQIADIGGYEVTVVFWEHISFSKGYKYSSSVKEREMFVIDDPTCREPIRVFASSRMQEIIKARVETVAESS